MSDAEVSNAPKSNSPIFTVKRLRRHLAECPPGAVLIDDGLARAILEELDRLSAELRKFYPPAGED